MKYLQLKPTIALAATFALLSTGVFAQNDQAPPKGYVTGKDGGFVRDHEGHCVRTVAWSKEIANKECNPELFPEPAAAAAAVPPVYESFTLNAAALFGFDSANLSPEGKAALAELGEKIRSKGATVVDIDVIGHTDSAGPEDYNQQLSERRASAVRDYIVDEKGIDPVIIDVSGQGESNPVADNTSTEGRSLNRRVEVNIGVKGPM